MKGVRPDLQVWVITGDGDGLSIGGNHLMHAIRRNVNLKIILFNNQIYGLTKGQYSPTSPLGKRTKSTPQGSIDNPLSPLSVAIGSEATFVARSVDVDTKHLTSILERAAHHTGTAFIEVYQDCNVFNSGAFYYASKKGVKENNIVYLEHGKPLIYGSDRDKGIRVNEGNRPEVVELGSGISEDDLLFHDEEADEPSLALPARANAAPGVSRTRRGLPQRATTGLRYRARRTGLRSHRTTRTRRPRDVVQQWRHLDRRIEVLPVVVRPWSFSDAVSRLWI